MRPSSAYGNSTEKMYRNGVRRARTKKSTFSMTGTTYGVSRRIQRCQLPPFTAETRVRSPLGAPIKSIRYDDARELVSRLCPFREERLLRSPPSTSFSEFL